MPRSKSTTSNSINDTTSNSLKEGEALIKNKESGKEMVVEALHAMQVLRKQGWDIVEIELDINQAQKFCDNYQIAYHLPPTKADLLDAIEKRF